MLAKRKTKYLDALGVEVWKRKPLEKASTRERQCSVGSDLPATTASAQKEERIADSNEQWQILEARVKKCQLCPLHKSRTQAVFGVGKKDAHLMFIGEAPGANEDLKGEPFVGRAGMLLTAMIKSIGLSREEVYIANILKCRPPHNRDPELTEVTLCTPFLKEQIALIRPKLIVAVGRIAARFLLNTEEPMSALRGKIYAYDYAIQKVPLLVTYHPAYLLRSPREKRKAYYDMLMIAKMLSDVKAK